MTRTIAVLSALATVLHAGQALACGGVFCNQQAPVVQSGERILFLQQSDGRLVTYVQIQYTGQSQNFSWVVPVKGTPTVEAGSDVTFSVLEAQTAPQYTVTQPSCGPPSTGYAADKVSNSSGCAGNTGFAGGLAPQSASRFADVAVLSQGAAGPYSYVILAATDSDGLFGWLTQNGYTLTDQGKSLLKLYVDADHHFLAVKLAPDRTVGDLRPLVIRSDEPEPCIPLRLTAVAATNDMPIEAFIVGAKRAVPHNYAHVVLNDARIDYRQGGSNYQALLGEAVDQAPGGEGFVTEYAAPTLAMQGTIWPAGGYPVDGLRTLDQGSYFLAVAALNIPYTASFVAWGQRWQGLNFDAQKATDDLVKDILTPMQTAQAMIDSGAYMTRLTTTISPEEMLDDPTFTYTSAMGDVSNVHTATDPSTCYSSESGNNLILADGRTLKYGDNSTAGATGWEAGPAALTVQRFDDQGEAKVLEDHVAEVPQNVRVGQGGGCRTAAATGGALAWMGAALGGLALLRRRRD